VFAARLALLLTLCFGCSTPGAESRTDVDDFGSPIEFAARPGRVVSLNPTTTEIIFTIGAGDRLIGRSRWDSWPPEAQRLPSLGDGIRPSVEALLAVRPDLVVLYASDDNRSAADRLRSSGVQTISLRVDGIAEFRRATLLLGRLLGDTARAMNVVDSVQRTLDSVRSATSASPRVRAFFVAWERPLITVGRASHLTELLAIAGADNVYGDSPEPSLTVSLEDVVARDPEVVLTSAASAERIRAASAWQAVRAVREGRILVYDTNLVGRPSVTLGMAAADLARLLDRNRHR
jgi:ABC-type Fe3+-hydroxamate transport system substrate-binding protein